MVEYWLHIKKLIKIDKGWQKQLEFGCPNWTKYPPRPPIQTPQLMHAKPFYLTARVYRQTDRQGDSSILASSFTAGGITRVDRSKQTCANCCLMLASSSASFSCRPWSLLISAWRPPSPVTGNKLSMYNIYIKHLFICDEALEKRHIKWWFVNPDTFVPGRYFRINEFSGLLNCPSVQERKSVTALFVRISEISRLSEPGLTNHHCTRHIETCNESCDSWPAFDTAD